MKPEQPMGPEIKGPFEKTDRTEERLKQMYEKLPEADKLTYDALVTEQKEKMADLEKTQKENYQDALDVETKKELQREEMRNRHAHRPGWSKGKSLDDMKEDAEKTAQATVDKTNEEDRRTAEIENFESRYNCLTVQTNRYQEKKDNTAEKVKADFTKAAENDER